MRRLLPALIFLSTNLWAAGSASPVHETWLVEGVPSAQTIAAWSKLPDSRNFLFRTATPSSEELNRIGRLAKADLIQLEATAYPEQSDLAAWRALAQKGAQFIGLDLQLPTEEQISVLNEIGFSRIIFLLGYIPDLDEGKRLGEIHSPVSVTLATSNFPRYDDRELLMAIPATIPLTMVGSYWPGYTHMDLFNLLPHTKRLRINEAFPSEDELPYLTNIHNLEEITVETSYDPPSPDLWSRMGTARIQWICNGRVPSADSLGAFEASGGPATRKLTLDKDGDLFPEERAALRGLKIPVEWVHSVPLSTSKGN